MGKKHVIIGAGPAGLSAAAAIRRTGSDDEITIISRESCPPYSPAALPYLFDGEMTEEQLFAKGKRALEELKVDFIGKAETVALDASAGTVGLSGGEMLAYDDLLIATGASPSVHAVEGLRRESMLSLRTYRDYLDIKSRAGNVAIYGAGLVAVELAEKLAHAGVKTAIIARSRLLRRYFAPALAKRVEDILSARGISVHSGSPVARASYDGAYRIELQNGGVIESGVFVSAVGVSANLPFGDALHTESGGIRVDRQMRTSLPNVYAAGDVAAVPGLFGGESSVCPILTEAIEQGKVAGLNMAGEKSDYRGGFPANMLRCFDDYFFSAGLCDESSASQEYSEEGRGYFKLFWRDGAVTGIQGWNRTEYNAGVFRYLIREKIPVQDALDLLKKEPSQTARVLAAQYRVRQAIGLTRSN